MTFVYRGARVVPFLVGGIISLGLLLSGVAVAMSRDTLAPQTCPPPAAPSSFWGYVTLNGAPAPAGLKVAAWIGGVEVASTATLDMGGATYYLLDVPLRAVDPTTGQVCRQGGATGETVTFVLCDLLAANQTGAWYGGTQVQRDLTASGSCTAAQYDWGDLPDPPYPTLTSRDGPRHVLGAGLLLGDTVDDELDGQPNSSATGDGDDGVLILPAPNALHGGWLNGLAADGNGCRYQVTIGGGSGVLQLWMDFGAGLAPVSILDADGAALPGGLLAPGVHTVACDVPDGTFDGTGNRAIAARFRLSSAGGLAATGSAPDGEVEDYIFNFGPTAVTLRDFRGTAGGGRSVAAAVAVLCLASGGWLLARRRIHHQRD